MNPGIIFLKHVFSLFIIVITFNYLYNACSCYTETDIFRKAITISRDTLCEHNGKNYVGEFMWGFSTIMLLILGFVIIMQLYPIIIVGAIMIYIVKFIINLLYVYITFFYSDMFDFLWLLNVDMRNRDLFN